MLETGAVDPTTSSTSNLAGTSEESSKGADLGEIVDYVTAYAKQETIGPMKGAGRWLAFGTAAAFMLGIGLLIVLLGLLRLLQTEWEWAASGSWSWIAYLVVAVVCMIVLAVTLSRIKRDQLNKDPF